MILSKPDITKELEEGDLDPGAIPRGRRNLAAVLRHANEIVSVDDVVSVLDITRSAATKLLSRWTRQGWLRLPGPAADGSKGAASSG